MVNLQTIFFNSGLTGAALQVLFGIVSERAGQELDLILNASEELRKLERSLLRIQGLLDDVEGQHLSNKAWQGWFHDAEDLLAEIHLEIMKLNSDIVGIDRSQVSKVMLSLTSLTIPHKIEVLRKKVEYMLGEVDNPFMIERVTKRITRRPHSSSLVDPSSVIGRVTDKEELVLMLLREKSGSGSRSGSGGDVSVIPIVGMGGIGKTTLAQFVYNDASVVKFFDLRVWVFVSVEYDAIRITKSIVESATGRKFELSDLDPVQVRLQVVLHGMRFLLVLDDMWNENTSDWDVLQRPFKFGKPGSKVLVTTRSSVVSSVVATMTPHYLQPLSNRDCWMLIAERALSNRNDLDDIENLKAIGERIAKKCRGLPLAAKTIGSVLRFKSTDEWEGLLESKLWDLPEAKNEVFPALMLSYDHLHAPLKRCFAYCSIFPHNYEFEKDELVHLWVAEGFIQPQGMRRIEDIGNDYFDNLLSRDFFQLKDNNLNPPVYHMHGLIHDLAQLVSADICLQVEDEMAYLSPTFRNTRHLALLYQDFQPLTSKEFQRCKCLRTFMMFYRNGSNIVNAQRIVKFDYEFFLNLRYLKVLNLSSTNIFELPNSVGNLGNLRYLNLSYTNILKLPESITKLYGLETLKLKYCDGFHQLPTQMKNLVNLRHLDLDIKKLSSMPLGFGKLTRLQTLPAFIVGKDAGCQIGELKNMSNIRGTICITNLENVVNVTDAKDAMLDKKPYLDKLELQWNASRNGPDGINDAEAIEGLRPHDRLKELQLTNYGSPTLPSWLSDPSLCKSLCKLVSISLHNFQKCSDLSTLGCLPALKSLDIDKMHDLNRVDREFCGPSVRSFPSLELLKFCNMPKLEYWEGLMAEDMPCLRELAVENCPKLLRLPSLHFLSSLKNLNIHRCGQLLSLPDEGLPHSLNTLIISESDILSEGCRHGTGADWSKISGVPNVEIDYVKIQWQG